MSDFNLVNTWISSLEQPSHFTVSESTHSPAIAGSHGYQNIHELNLSHQDSGLCLVLEQVYETMNVRTNMGIALLHKPGMSGRDYPFATEAGTKLGHLSALGPFQIEVM